MTPRSFLPAFGLVFLLIAAHPALAQTYHAGAGLTLTGTTFSIANGGVTGAMIGLPLSLTGASSNPILTVTNTGSGYGIKTVSSSGTGTYGTNTKYGNVGTLGDINGFGVYGSTAAGPYPYGVFGINRASGNGDYGILGGNDPITGSKIPLGVFGSDTSSFGYGVFGNSTHEIGVLGNSTGSYGVYGASSSIGIDENGSGTGVQGTSGSGTGVSGASKGGYGGSFTSASSTGAVGTSSSSYGLFGQSINGTGVYGTNTTSGDFGLLGGLDGLNHLPVGVYGSDSAANGDGVLGSSTSDGGDGVYGYCTGQNGYGVYGEGNGPGGYGGFFLGNVSVTGTLTAGAKNFKIDHPLDPEHKYLFHASIESDEMTDLYSGNVTTDANGNATVMMPRWFQALNTDFRYQLTCLGGFAPVYIAQKVQNNQFQIAGGKPGMEVSWQVTGVRHDAFAVAHPMHVEQDKPESEQGLYQNPEAFGQPDSRGLSERRKQEKR